MQGLDAYFDINGYYCSAFKRFVDSGSCNKLTEERKASRSKDMRKRRSDRVLSSPQEEVN